MTNYIAVAMDILYCNKTLKTPVTNQSLLLLRSRVDGKNTGAK